MSVHTTMVDKNGKEWLAGSPTEVNDLLAAGYTFKGHAPGDVTPPPSEPPKSATPRKRSE